MRCMITANRRASATIAFFIAFGRRPPACNTQAMQLHLDEIAKKVTPGAHALLILDQAGWHGAKDIKLPGNISLLPLPPRAPELNGQENVWQIHAAELALQPNLQVLRRYRGSLLLCLEYPHGSGLENHVSLAAIGQSSVIHCEDWYKRAMLRLLL
jgi:hypothetical protein